MTALQAYRHLLPQTVGFDHLFSTLDEMVDLKTTSYPPYNIKKIDETNYSIDVAIAGFNKDEVEIRVEGDKLTVIGETINEDTSTYLHKGIANRNFTLNFTLSDTVVVGDAEFNNGILSIGLENVIPESKKPRTITIK